MTDTTNSSDHTDRLHRPRQGRMMAGVAAAVSNRTGLDVGLVRIGFVVSCFFGGLGLVMYVAAWVLIPEEGDSKAPAERFLGS